MYAHVHVWQSKEMCACMTVPSKWNDIVQNSAILYMYMHVLGVLINSVLIIVLINHQYFVV